METEIQIAQKSIDTGKRQDKKHPPPLKAIRTYCLWCCNDQWREVELCPAEDCPMWPYRFGRKPKDQPSRSRLKVIRERYLDCVGYSQKAVRDCWDTSCPLYEYRMGKNPKLLGKRGKGDPDTLRKWRENQKN